MSTIRHPNKIEGRTFVLVAGTGGLGVAIASALLAKGGKVILTSTRQAKLDTVISKLQAAYPEVSADRVTGYVLDLGSDQVDANVAKVVGQLTSNGVNNIHHLIYLAGDPLPTCDISEVTIEKWHKASHVRIVGFLMCVKHFLPLLKASLPASHETSPSIVVTSGSVSDKPIPGGWGLVAMIAGGYNAGARQLAYDLAPIRVNAVAPGVVDTDLWSGMPAEQRQAFMENLSKTMPTGRAATAQDLAESYLYAVQDANLTGEIIRSNSGAFLV